MGTVQSSFPRARGWSLGSAGRAVSVGILVAPGARISPDPTVLPTELGHAGARAGTQGAAVRVPALACTSGPAPYPAHTVRYI